MSGEAVFVHSHGLCESDEVGPGTRVWAFAHVLPGAVIGADCNICDHVFVESGARIGDRVTVKNAVLVWDLVTVEDDVFLGPNMVFTNDFRPRAEVKKTRDALTPTLIRRGATIGANATIVAGVIVGEYAFVAAGAVVVRDVPAYALVAGNPGRALGWVCACGERLDSQLRCVACSKVYKPAADTDGLCEAVSAGVSAPGGVSAPAGGSMPSAVSVP
ncbi:acyltransferase [Frankia sp. Cr2]|uniref:acyltransferase n=1 Tax=Frankia sp. Cr2 TaxID=3073932 RepID=UPI002AD27A5B|nr:acyltransferase [Frankia sp. Cr2]